MKPKSSHRQAVSPQRPDGFVPLPKFTSLTDLASISVDFSEDSLEIKTFVPVRDGSLSEFSLVVVDDGITASGVKMPPELRSAVHALGHQALKLVRDHLTGDRGAPPCTTCKGACCYAYDAVHVTSEDVAVLDHHKHKGYKLYEQPTLSGHVGELLKKPRSIGGDVIETACIYLRPSGCSIYEHRPRVCREYSAWTCGDTYEADPHKVQNKVRLRVVP